MCDILPIGQGHGSVFLLGKTIDRNASSRIGSTAKGDTFGGDGGLSAFGSKGGYGICNYL